MENHDRKLLNRREWVRALARGGALAAIAIVGALAAVTKNDGPTDQTCTNRYLCQNCKTLTKCHLPQALSLKQVLAKR
jgi:hypothetical protein